MRSVQGIGKIALGLLGLLILGTVGSGLLISCTASAIPTAPPTATPTPRAPTSTPTTANTPTYTYTYTSALLTASPTPSFTPTQTYTPTPGGVGPGAIAFTGLTYNGNSQVSFINTVALTANQVIYFTNYSYDDTANSGAGGLVDESTSCCTAGSNGLTIIEGTVAWTAPAGGVTALSTQIVFGKTGTTTTGTVANFAGAGAAAYLVQNHNGSGHKVLAYVTTGAASTGVTTWVAGIIFGPDSWQAHGPISSNASYDTLSTTGPAFFDSVLPPGLDNTTSIDLSGQWSSGTLSTDEAVGMQNDNAILNSCQTTLAGIVNPANWVVDGNQSKTAVNLNPIGPAPTSACSAGSGGYGGGLP